MVSSELLEILRCPNCVREKEGMLVFIKTPGLFVRIADANTRSWMTSP
jgi:uncharacterized protein YbaR (Trm112 family)